MFIRRLQNLPILCLLIFCLLVGPAITTDYASGDAAQNCSLRNDANPGAYAPDNFVENATYRWENSPTCQGQKLSRPLASIPPTIVVAQGPLFVRSLNLHRIVNPSPRTPDQILHHRTIVLQI